MIVSKPTGSCLKVGRPHEWLSPLHSAQKELHYRTGQLFGWSAGTPEGSER